jgi:hypothetical protein
MGGFFSTEEPADNIEIDQRKDLTPPLAEDLELMEVIEPKPYTGEHTIVERVTDEEIDNMVRPISKFRTGGRKNKVKKVIGKKTKKVIGKKTKTVPGASRKETILKNNYNTQNIQRKYNYYK